MIFKSPTPAQTKTSAKKTGSTLYGVALKMRVVPCPFQMKRTDLNLEAVALKRRSVLVSDQVLIQSYSFYFLKLCSPFISNQNNVGTKTNARLVATGYYDTLNNRNEKMFVNL